jgi:IS30 family transposase
MAYKRVTARRLLRSASSISREILRNTGFRDYRPKQAQAAATARALRSGPRRFTEEFRRLWFELLIHEYNISTGIR